MVESVKIADWLKSHSRWNQLRELGSSNLVRASVLMPAFGYMLLLNENIHQYLTVKYDGWVFSHLHVASVWRIWMLFYGSFLLALATIVYGYFCPDEVKRYASAFEMADGETKASSQPQPISNCSAASERYVRSVVRLGTVASTVEAANSRPR